MPITPLPCPKCGTEVTRAGFCDSRFYPQRLCNSHWRRDHFHRTCPDCGYTWITETP